MKKKAKKQQKKPVSGRVTLRVPNTAAKQKVRQPLDGSGIIPVAGYS